MYVVHLLFNLHFSSYEQVQDTLCFVSGSLMLLFPFICSVLRITFQYFLQPVQSSTVSDRDQIELYISSSVKNSFARVSVLAQCLYFSNSYISMPIIIKMPKRDKDNCKGSENILNNRINMIVHLKHEIHYGS